MSTTLAAFLYLIAAVAFIFGLRQLQSPVTARRGNQLAAGGMLVAIVVTLLVMATIIPCVNAAIVLLKERGVKLASMIGLSVMAYSLIVGGVVSHVCSALGITFT